MPLPFQPRWHRVLHIVNSGQCFRETNVRPVLQHQYLHAKIQVLDLERQLNQFRYCHL